jgi:hypothetical protein
MRKFKKRAIVAENRLNYLKQRLEKAEEKIEGLQEIHLLESSIITQMIKDHGEITIDRSKVKDNLGMLVKIEIDGEKIIVRKAE